MRAPTRSRSAAAPSSSRSSCRARAARSRTPTKKWWLNNLLGCAFSIQGIEMLALGSYAIGVILLCGLFVYDVFWVFGTEVMVSVAKVASSSSSNSSRSIAFIFLRFSFSHRVCFFALLHARAGPQRAGEDPLSKSWACSRSRCLCSAWATS